MTLYAITDEHLIPAARFVATVEQALLGGVDAVQFRDKETSPDERLERGEALKALCDAYGVPLIVNDSAALAGAVHASGVHLGRDDGGIAAARAVLGKRAMIGVSCYDSLELALEAEGAGASYVAFGAMFPSRLKPDAVRAPLALLQEAHERLRIPVCAIGGIDATNVAEVISHGADIVAVCNGIFAAPDVRAAARELRERIDAARDAIDRPLSTVS